MMFSIVTPAFNAEAHLREMLASVRRQSVLDWELRIVDDGSSDATRAIMEEAALDDPRIKPLYLDANSGSCFYPRRLAIEHSEGDYIVNIDADDTIEKDYLYNLQSRILQTGADIIYADMYVTGREDEPSKFITADESRYNRILSGESIFNLTLDRWEVSGVGATSRRLALASMELFDSEFSLDRYCGTFENENLTRIDLFLARNVAFAKAAYFYRHNPESVSRKTSVKKFELLEADSYLCEFVGKYFGKDSVQYREANRQLFHHSIECLRLLNAHPWFEDRDLAVAITRQALKDIDLKAVRGVVSPGYRALVRSGYHFAKKILGIYDGRKKGE